MNLLTHINHQNIIELSQLMLSASEVIFSTWSIESHSNEGVVDMISQDDFEETVMDDKKILEDMTSTPDSRDKIIATMEAMDMQYLTAANLITASAHAKDI